MSATESHIAVIGMGLRLPGAETPEQFWQNLLSGTESLSRLNVDDVKKIDERWSMPDYVPVAAALRDVELFDAGFFGLSRLEAELMDPQQRVFLECSWEALERAGCLQERLLARTAVFAGSGVNTYLLRNLYSRPDLLAQFGAFQVMINNDKDYLPTRTSYLLNLRGPSVCVQTGCSTSLVAVHMASQSLLSFECDVALAGGSTVRVPNQVGYVYQEGMIASPDGHCRAFDAKAQGTVEGSGVGAVVLKRLEDAIRDGDHIHATLIASAINNDGGGKGSFTAPGVRGQTEAVAEAIDLAGISSELIAYVETHGTGTYLGDPIEVAALSEAFRRTTTKKNYCGIGSVKTNIGHADAASGIAGFIKCALAVEHGEIPPSLHFTRANPHIDLEASPFYVNDTLRPWPEIAGPRHAAVSSFGIGGTNVHAVLREAPRVAASGVSRPWSILRLSAQSEAALEEMSGSLEAHLEGHPDCALADAAYTLATGRRDFEHRRSVIARTRAEAVSALRSSRGTSTRSPAGASSPVVFLFPGGGAQYPGMGADLIEAEPSFRVRLRECSEQFGPQLGLDLFDLISRRNDARAEMSQPVSGLSALFAVEYALAQTWLHWGITPFALLGHSAGEYVAACLAGVFSLPDAVRVVIKRAEILARLPPGGMLNAAVSENMARELLTTFPDLSLAAVNAPQQCVFSGRCEHLRELQDTLAARGVNCKKVNINVAAHSAMLDPSLPEFEALLNSIPLGRPTIPIMSSTRGRWLAVAEATAATYWVDHLRYAVRYADAVRALVKEVNPVMLEVGPGSTLGMLAQMQPDCGEARTIASMRQANAEESENEVLTSAVAQLWQCGGNINSEPYFAGEKRRRVDLPTYPFQRRRCWIDPPTEISVPVAEREGYAYERCWRSAPSPELTYGAPETWLVFMDDAGIALRALERRCRSEDRIVQVRAGDEYLKLNDGSYVIRPGETAAYKQLLLDVGVASTRISALHGWSLDQQEGSREHSFADSTEKGYYSLLSLCQALQQVSSVYADVVVLGQGILTMAGAECSPAKMTILASCIVPPQENRLLAIRVVDLDRETAELCGKPDHPMTTVIAAEIGAGGSCFLVMYRSGERFTPSFVKTFLEGQVRTLRREGSYFIVGGLGTVGLALAKHLAKTVKACLTLVHRSSFPERDDWEHWVETHGESDRTSIRIRIIREIEALGARVLTVQADIADSAQMNAALSLTEKIYGRVNGFIHAAGVTAVDRSVVFFEATTREVSEEQFKAKVHGLWCLDELLQKSSADFCLLVSSNASVLGGLGLTAYAAANIYMEGFAQRRRSASATVWLATSWDAWIDSDADVASLPAGMRENGLPLVVAAEQAFEIVERSRSAQVFLSSTDLNVRVETWIHPAGSRRATQEVDDAELASLRVTGRDLAAEITARWEAILGCSGISPDDNFFALGGHSLLAITMINQLREEYGVSLPLRQLLKKATIRGLVDAISATTRGSQDEAAGSPPVRRI